MKRTIHILLVAAMMLTLGACTRNHGDIGIWFGTWHVESITAAGGSYQYIVPVDIEGDYFFQFQNKVFRVSQVTAREQAVESYGTWEENEDANTLTVTFPDANVYYIDMPGLEARNEFVIQKRSHGQLELTRVMADGTTCVYALKKQP